MTTNIQYNFYDNIIRATYINIAASSSHSIIFNNFEKDKFSHKIFLKTGFIVAAFEDKQIYLNCKLFDFFKILFHNYSIKDILLRHTRLHYLKKESPIGINIDFFADYEANDYKTDISIFEKIWKEYYENGTD